MPKKRAIVSFATGRYVKSLNRLMEVFDKIPDRSFDLLAFKVLPTGSASHQSIPYHFKPMAIWETYQMGYTSIIWMDSVIMPQQSMDIVFDIIERDGYLVFLNGWDSGQWCCDSALQPLGLTREESFTYPQSMACVLGFDLSKKEPMDVFTMWKDNAHLTFPGPWKNTNGEASSDYRVLGHRHDQTAISIYAHRAGWRFTPPDENNLICYGWNESYVMNSYPVT